MPVRRLLLALVVSPALLRGAPVPVTLAPDGSLRRGGKPYFIHGAGGSDRLDELARRGGNSVRTWSDDGLAQTLDAAAQHGLTVCAGIWLEPEVAWFSYAKPADCRRQAERVRKAVRAHRGHAALLVWALGNESEGDGRNAAYWKQLDALAQLVHTEDPAHPVCTVVAGLSAEKAAGLNTHAPHLDFVGINTYAALPELRAHLAGVNWTRPWTVTEFGVRGFWESERTAWQAPVEQTSTEKAAFLRDAYQKSIAPAGRCWGGYAFFWGQKQEATSTWFGLFTAEGESIASVDVLEELWTGHPPANRAPRVGRLTLRKSTTIVVPGTPCTATAEATDPDNDPLTWHWSIAPESAGREADGREKPVAPIAGLVTESGAGQAEFRAPTEAGAYRVYLRVTDGQGHAATANTPFQVK